MCTGDVPAPRRALSTARLAVFELGVAATVFLLYRAGRTLTRTDSGAAFDNARWVRSVESQLGVWTEAAVQDIALRSEHLVQALNWYYVGVHFPLTIAFLVWLFARHRSTYRPVRNWFVVVTLSSLAIHVAFPLAPPRMLGGFVDTLHRFGPRIYSTDVNDSVANQFAAMPSLHFGWALIVALGIVWIKRSRRSVLAFAHPSLTLLTIVATGNHYWFDAALAGVLVLATALVFVAVGHTGRREQCLEPEQPGHPELEPAPTIAA
jgi:hypothetical protein